jgi:PPIC-type PPIASE domain
MTSILHHDSQTHDSLLEQLRQHSAQELIPLLASYQMIPQLLCAGIIDRATDPIKCTAEETTEACQQYQRGSHYGLNQAQFEQMATRSIRIEKFKQAMWGHKLESYFLQRKRDLDQVIYSLLRTKQQDMAQELFFRIQEGEQSFAEVAQQYSEGAEAETKGLMGPVELGTLNLKLADLLSTMPVGQVEPFGLGEWCMVIRLEKRIPARLDDAMRQRLLEEKFETWVRSQIDQLDDQDKVWLSVGSSQSIDSDQYTTAA